MVRLDGHATRLADSALAATNTKVRALCGVHIHGVRTSIPHVRNSKQERDYREREKASTQLSGGARSRRRCQSVCTGTFPVLDLVTPPSIPWYVCVGVGCCWSGQPMTLNGLVVSQRPCTQSHWPTVAVRLVGSALWLHTGSRHFHSSFRRREPRPQTHHDVGSSAGRAPRCL